MISGGSMSLGNAQPERQFYLNRRFAAVIGIVMFVALVVFLYAAWKHFPPTFDRRMLFLGWVYVGVIVSIYGATGILTALSRDSARFSIDDLGIRNDLYLAGYPGRICWSEISNVSLSQDKRWGDWKMHVELFRDLVIDQGFYRKLIYRLHSTYGSNNKPRVGFFLGWYAAPPETIFRAVQDGLATARRQGAVAEASAPPFGT